ncbi:hypothetical protein CYL31_04060 [Marinomonas sp. A3A]|nr:hypothetical protein CYL31_04060 [Marinomonas sp. A3A]
MTFDDMKKIKYTFAIFTIFTCIVFFFDGVGDFLLYARYKIMQPSMKSKFIEHLPDSVDKAFYSNSFDDTNKFIYQNVPFLGRTITSGNYGIYEIDGYSHRVFKKMESNDFDKEKSLLILGSSQSFGYYNDVSDTISEEIKRILPGYTIDNYSMPGTNLDDNLMDWYRVANVENKKYNLVVIINGNFSHYKECLGIDYNFFETLIDKYRLPAIVSIGNIIKIKALQNKAIQNENIFCELPEYQDVAAKRVLDRWNRLINFGKEQGSDVLIFIPPTVWSGKANVENLQPLLNEKYKKIYSSINNAIYSKVNNEVIVNLTNAFDDGAQYFLDVSSHFTPEGSALLAKDIVKHIEKIEHKVSD